MVLLDIAAGMLLAVACVWVGFYLGRLTPESKPTIHLPEREYEGAILDFAVYEGEVADE